MSEFEKQYQNILNNLQFEDFNWVTKRIIDLTLDTENESFYSRTVAFLNYIDSQPSTEDIKIECQKILSELYAFLNNKTVPQKKLLVSCQEMTKKYSSNGFSLGPISLNIYEGEIIGLVGENGNGKTTLLRTLCGEFTPTSGILTYHFEYTDLYDLRTQLVYIPQRTETWHGSMFENLQFTATHYGYKPSENKWVVELVLARLGLRKYRKHKWKDLSSGYKMRFELARLLLRKSKILLIDEPLANLDILAQQTILEDFKTIAKSPFRPLGIVLSSQQLYEVEKTSDQVVFLKNGQQKNLHENSASTTERVLNFIVEFETTWTQNALDDLLRKHHLVSLHFNGSTFIAEFDHEFTSFDFLKIVHDAQIPMNYYRDISNSTRRFFLT
jgi:ABC-2 type transport system ATP-binding protein